MKETPFASVIREDGLLAESGLYKIINKINGHWYIGSTKMSFAKRFRRHRGLFRKGRHYNKHLQNAYNKYGEKNFVFVMVKHSRKKLFIKIEQKIIDKHFGKVYCYNESKDASAPMTGRKHSPETILKLRAASNKRAKEIGENTRRCRLGTKHSAKTIRKMRISAKKRDDSKRIAILKSPEFRAKISKVTKGRKLSPQHLKNLRVIFRSNSYRKKMSLIKKGIKLTASWKNKMSIARLGKTVTLINDRGIKENIISLRSFCKKYKINRHEVSKVVNGQRECYKGWKLS